MNQPNPCTLDVIFLYKPYNYSTLITFAFLSGTLDWELTAFGQTFQLVFVNLVAAGCDLPTFSNTDTVALRENT